MAEHDHNGSSNPSNPEWTPPPVRSYEPPGPAGAAAPPAYGGGSQPDTQHYPLYPAPGAPPNPYPSVPYQPPGYSPPPGPGAPFPGAVPPAPRGSMSGRTLAIVIVVLILIAGGVIGGVLASAGGSKHHSANATPSSSHSTSPSTSSSGPTSAPSTTGSSGAAVPSLLSIAPFSNCQKAPTIDHYSDATATDEISCTGADVTKESADAIIYERFASGTDLSTWYTHDVLATNDISQNEGNCSTLQVATTTKQAQYCEGAFTDDTGAAARQLVVLAPISVALTIGSNGSVAEGCSGASAYTLMVFTSPSDDVGVGVIACNGKAATAQAFESDMKNGDFDLND